MIGTIRKHQKWLWLVIITFTVISFVICFSPYSRMQSGLPHRAAELGTIRGRPITEEAFFSARREVYVHHFIASGGHWPTEQAARDMDPETIQWLALVREQDKYGIHVSDAAVSDVARSLLQNIQRAGFGSPEALARELERNGFGLDDYQRFVRHYLGERELICTLGLSAILAPPDQLRAQYIREHQEMAVDALLFTASNYLASVAVTPAAISDFYSNHLSEYRVPERVQVGYVKFPVTNYWAAAQQFLEKTNFNETIDEIFRRGGTNLFKDTKTPEETKTRIKEEMIRERALLDARRAASLFAGPLFDRAEMRAADLQTFAKNSNLTFAVTEPFDLDHLPKGLDVDEDFAYAAFRLNTNNPFGGPLRGRDGVYVLACDKNFPSEVPALDQIRDRVVADYKYEQALELARQAGQAFAAQLTNGLAQGKDFTTLCAQAKLKPVSLPPFALSTRSLPVTDASLDLNMLKQVAVITGLGKVSGFQWTREGGAIFWVKAQFPINEAQMRADLPGYFNAVRQDRLQEAFNMWFGPEFAREVSSPIINRLQQQQPPPPNISSRPSGKKA